MLPAKQDVISMIDRLPEQQLQKVVNYILLLKSNYKQKKRTGIHPVMSRIKIKYDPVESLTSEEWSDEA